jgi:hypothetical protein
MEGATTLSPGQLSVEFRAGVANIFEHDSASTHLLFVDMERLETSLAVRWGIANGLELGGLVALVTTGGGVMDEAIVGWHDLFGFPNADRDDFPYRNYRQLIQREGAPPVLDVPERRTFGLEDLRLSAKWRILSSADDRSVLSLRGVVRVPATPNSVAPEQTDGSLMALGRLGVGSWYLHGMLGRSFHRVSPTLQPVLNGGSTFATVTAERSLGSRLSALAQFEYQSAALRGFHVGEIDGNAFNLVLGVAGLIRNSWRWEVSFQEDLPAETPAMDFSLHLGLRRVF